jgi:23S rRNA (adenine2030-N6)-methyltransferase
MNYRHSFHAGNFADVLKHVVLSRLIEYLKLKDKAFRVVDTHAGAGVYSLRGGDAARTGEWHEGIEKMLGTEFSSDSASLFQPYFHAVQSVNPKGNLENYPGSPKISRYLMRKQDRLTAIELHPADAKLLAREFAGDFQTRVIELDGWLALGGHLPPKEKRGLVLIDPPFEEVGEFGRIVSGLRRAYDRWPGGIYALWYPIKDRKAVAAFQEELRETGIKKVLRIESTIRGAGAEPRLDGSGMIVINPPYTLFDELSVILPVLTKTLALDSGAGSRLDWITGE